MTIYAPGEQLGSARRECSDRLIALSNPHLRSKRRVWVTDCDRVRPLGAGRLVSRISTRARIGLMQYLRITGRLKESVSVDKSAGRGALLR
jgi:hypothetical protein